MIVFNIEMKPDNDNLAGAISELAHELKADRDQRVAEFEWLKAHGGPATKHDLDAMERRITAILLREEMPVASQALLDDLLAHSASIAARLTKLDEKTPPVVQ